MGGGGVRPRVQSSTESRVKARGDKRLRKALSKVTRCSPRAISADAIQASGMRFPAS
jgi:hypothetical protein